MIFPHSRERASPSLPPSHSFPFWRGEERTLLATFGPLSSSRWASPRPRSLASPSLSSSSSRGGNPGFNPFPYNFLPMHREKLARNTHAHARMAARAPSPLSSSSPPPPLAPAWPLARWRSPIIRFHRIFVVRAQASGPQTRIRQLTPLAWRSAIKAAVRGVEWSGRGANGSTHPKSRRALFREGGGSWPGRSV